MSALRLGLALVLLLLSFDTTQSLNMAGDYVIGGNFPVSLRSETDPKRCSVDRTIPGLLMLEELIFAVLRVNEDSCVLKNATLGFSARDHCNSQNIAIRVTTSFFDDDKITKVGVISHSQFKRELVQGLAGILDSKDPPVPYMSASPFQVLHGVASSSIFEVTSPRSRLSKAMLAIMKYFNWDYIVVVYVDDEEGKTKLNQFETTISDDFISIAGKFGMRAGPNDVRPVVRDIKSFVSNKTVNVVLLLTPAEISYNLTMEAAGQKLDLVWLTNEESWDMNKEVAPISLRTIGGIIHIGLQPPKTREEFKNYLSKIDFQEHMYLNPYYTPDVGDSLVKNVHKYNGIITDAVYAIAKAIDNRKNDSKTPLKEYLKKVDFSAPSGRRFSFNGQHMVETKYTIYNLQKARSSTKYAEVGHILISDTKGEVLEMYFPNVTLRWGSTRKGGVPKSRCSEPCGPGWYAVQDLTVPKKSCFTCQKCPLGEDSSTTNARSCFPVPWKQLQALITYGVVGALLLLILFLLIVFCRVPNACEIRYCTNATLHLLCSLALTALLPVALFLPVEPKFCNVYNGAYTLCLAIPLSILISQSKCFKDRVCERRSGEGRQGCACDPRPAVYTVLLLLNAVVTALFILYFPSSVLSMNYSDRNFDECSSHSDNFFLILFFYVIFLGSVLLLLSVNSLKRELGEFDTPSVCYCVLFFFILCLLYMFSRHFFEGPFKIIALAVVNFLHAINFLFFLFIPKLCMMSYHDFGNRPKISFLSPYELSQAQEKVSERLSNTLPRENQSPLLPQKVKVHDDSCKENGETTQF